MPYPDIVIVVYSCIKKCISTGNLQSIFTEITKYIYKIDVL